VAVSVKPIRFRKPLIKRSAQAVETTFMAG